jgi:hypothetical protein
MPALAGHAQQAMLRGGMGDPVTADGAAGNKQVADTLRQQRTVGYLV